MFREASKTSRTEALARIVMLLLLVSLLFTPAISYALNPTAIDTSMMQKTSIFANAILNANTASYTAKPNIKANMGLDEDAVADSGTSVGIDLLYGIANKSTIYYGEVPRWLREGSEDNKSNTYSDFKDFPAYDFSDINGTFRSYNRDTPFNNDGIFQYITAYQGDGDKTKGIEDLHCYSLTKSNNILSPILTTATNILFFIFSSIYALATFILTLLITVVNVEPGDLLAWLGFERFNNLISQLFLFTDGHISPIFLIAVLVFVVGLVGLIVKRLKGEAALSEVIREFLFLLLAALLSMVALSGGAGLLQSSIQTLGIMLTDNMAGGENNNTQRMFVYDVDGVSASENLKRTQIALSQKPFVDLVINCQFGCPYSSLDLPHDGDEGDFGSKATAIIKSIAYENDTWNDGYVLRCSNSASGANPIYNLGYYWYCASSSVNPRLPFNGDYSINSGSQYNVLYVMDFISAVNASAGDEADGQALIEKTQSIADTFASPSQNIGYLLLITLAQLFTCLSIGIISIFTLIAKLIFYCGVLLVPAFPIMLLIPSTRTKCQDLLIIWFASGMKMLVGLSLVTITLTFSTTLCEFGVQGIFVDLVFLLVMFFASPKIMKELNKVFGKYENRFAPTSWANRMSNQAYDWVGKARKGKGDALLKAMRAKEEAAETEDKNRQERLKEEAEANEGFDKMLTNAKNIFDEGNPNMIGGGEGDPLLNDAQYQLDKRRIQDEYEKGFEPLQEEAQQYKEIEDKYRALNQTNQVRQTYRHQRMDYLERTGQKNSKEYRELVKEQLMFDRNCDAASITDKDIASYRMSKQERDFFCKFQTTRIEKKDYKSVLVAAMDADRENGRISKAAEEETWKQVGKTALGNSTVAQFIKGVGQKGNEKLDKARGIDRGRGSQILSSVTGKQAAQGRANEMKKDLDNKRQPLLNEAKKKMNEAKVGAYQRQAAKERAAAQQMTNDSSGSGNVRKIPPPKKDLE